MGDSKISLVTDTKADATKASQNTAVESSGFNLVSLAQSVKENAVAPAWNSLAIEPVNVGINIVNGASEASTWTVNQVFSTSYKAPVAGKVIEMQVGHVEKGSAGYYSQQILGTAGSFLAYAVAGKVAGKVLGTVSEFGPLENQISKLKAGAAILAVARNSRLATVVGATGYAALKDPHAGESRWSNAAGTFVGFTAFEGGNSLISPNSSFKFGKRYFVGSLGGEAQANVASLIQDKRFADKETLAANALSGGLLNAIMPAGRQAVDTVTTKVSKISRLSNDLPPPRAGEPPAPLENHAFKRELSNSAPSIEAPPRIIPIADVLAHAGSSESFAAKYLIPKQAKLFGLLEDAHKAANLTGLEVTSRQEFPEPTTLSEGPMAGADVTAVTEYANGIKVYENPSGIKQRGKPDYFGQPTRMVTDHNTFIKKEWQPKATIPDGVGGGATVDAVYEFRNGGAAYVNEAGLFGPRSERILLQSYDARLRLFDKADEAAHYEIDPRLDSNVSRIVDNFSGSKSDRRIENLIEQFPESDRVYVRTILGLSRQNIDSSNIMAHFRQAGTEATSWYRDNRGAKNLDLTTSLHPAADESSVGLSYISDKAVRGFDDGSPVLSQLNHLAEIGHLGNDSAFVLYGDVTKYTPAEIAELKARQAQGVKFGIFDNQFDRGVNAIDLHLGTAKSKLQTLVAAAKSKQASDGLTPEKASQAVMHEPAEDLAQKLQAPIFGRNDGRPLEASAPTGATAGPASESLEAMAARIKNYITENHPLRDDQMAVVDIYANGIKYFDLPEMLNGLQALHPEIVKAAGADPIYITKNAKSQAFINFLYKRVNRIENGQFLSEYEVEKLPLEQRRNRALVLLDDAAYSGEQIEKNVGDVRGRTNYENPVVVANLASYQKAYTRNSDVPIVSTETVLPFYEVKGLRADTSGSENGVTNTKLLPPGETLTPQQVQYLRQASFFEFNRDGTWGRMGNRLIFFYKVADSTPRFIAKFLGDFFNIGL